jgi:hypothetical protein
VELLQPGSLLREVVLSEEEEESLLHFVLEVSGLKPAGQVATQVPELRRRPVSHLEQREGLDGSGVMHAVLHSPETRAKGAVQPVHMATCGLLLTEQVLQSALPVTDGSEQVRQLV